MIPLRKIIPLDPFPRKIGHDDKVMLWGSCFADELSRCLERELYDVTRSPFGIMYNPLSMAEGIIRLLDGVSPAADELFLSDGLWVSDMHHGAFSGTDKEQTLCDMGKAFDVAQNALSQTRLFVFTFGTSYIYEDRTTGMVVNNCHKRPATDFTRRRASVEEISDRWISIVKRLFDIAPEADILFSVSPIPHYRDGVRENSLSKSVLHLSIEEVIQASFPKKPFYFPSYEILRDELRDYRFYADDFVHPTSLAVSYIMDRFSDHYLAPWQGQSEWHKLCALIGHRPLTKDPDRLKAHYASILDKLRPLCDKNPHPYLRDVLQDITLLYDAL